MVNLISVNKFIEDCFGNNRSRDAVKKVFLLKLNHNYLNSNCYANFGIDILTYIVLLYLPFDEEERFTRIKGCLK